MDNFHSHKYRLHFSVCFKIFDIDRDGVLDAKEIAEMINILLLVAKEGSASMAVRSLSYDQVYNELRDRALDGTGKVKAKAAKESFTFTQEDFMMWSVQSQLNLLQPFLDLLFEVCHVVLGLRPQCRHLEHNIGRCNQVGAFIIRTNSQFLFLSEHLQ